MNKKEIDNLKAILGPELLEIGYELVDLEMERKSRENYLSFYIYKDGGIDLEDCEKASRYLDKRLDELDPIPQFYYLEVSSPDLNRPLKTERDLERNIGEKIKLTFFKKIDNEKTKSGILLGFDEESIELDMDGKRVKFPRGLIANIVVDLF